MTRGIETNTLIAIVALCPTLALAAPQNPPSAPVTVVNTPSNPVPVSLQGAGTVSVTNEVTVRDSDNPAFQPVSARGSFTFADGVGPHASGQSIYTVPAGKRLVIEHAAGRVSAVPAVNTGRAYMALHVSSNEGSVFLPIGTTSEAAPCTLTQACLVISKALRLYAEPGSSIFVDLGGLLSQSSNFTRGDVTISGYLIDIP